MTWLRDARGLYALQGRMGRGSIKTTERCLKCGYLTYEQQQANVIAAGTEAPPRATAAKAATEEARCAKGSPGPMGSRPSSRKSARRGRSGVVPAGRQTNKKQRRRAGCGAGPTKGLTDGRLTIERTAS